MNRPQMNSRERFHAALNYGRPDRVPLFVEGIRDSVVCAWRNEGMPPDKSLEELFCYDPRLELAPELEPNLDLVTWLKNHRDLAVLHNSLDPEDPTRLPEGWPDSARAAYAQGDTVMLRVHRGLYQTFGVTNWQGFEDINFLLLDDPALVHTVLEIQANFAVQLVEKILPVVNIDAAIFSEPVSDNNGPLISPKMFAEFAFRSYRPLLELLHRASVKWIIFRSYANARILVPLILNWGFNCLWACEENFGEMNYQKMRREFGHDLRLLGGIDVDVLRQDKKLIQQEVLGKVPPLLAGGGYIPLADGRIRENIPYDNYVFYRNLLQKAAAGEL